MDKVGIAWDYELYLLREVAIPFYDERNLLAMQYTDSNKLRGDSCRGDVFGV